MPREKKYQLFLLLILFCCCELSAQEQAPALPDDPISFSTPDSLVTVGEISITGNKKTKEMIVLRELPFKTGEVYPRDILVKKMEEARRQLINTALFTHVMVTAKSMEGKKINVTVELKERWYLFPIPYFRPVDRNLNQWLFDNNASLDRVNYGVKFSYNNATGRNDKIRLSLVSGYTKQVMMSYDRPYIDKQLKWGVKFSLATGKNREINYNTINDKQVFLKDANAYVRSFNNADAVLTYRRAIKTRHSFGISYAYEQVNDTIVALNPSFFKSGRNSIAYPGISYMMNYLDLDFNAYPTRGYSAQLVLGKTGFNNIINIWQLHAKGLGVWPVSSKTFFSLNVYGGIKLPFKQPYFSRRFLGYGDAFMQGFEYYVIDGVAGGYIKAGFTRELLNFSVRAPALKKGKTRENVPVRIFARVFGNSGYVHDPQPGNNSLSNKMLYSGGVGLDLLTLYNLTFKLEWTFNSLGQNGLFLHR
ncbi:MAG TPA: POTRA domain-containing protein [Chitinophagaceae bacterium]|jgi:outer membrane protein assembly factor BamA|nr:POTRA domain-containing protein [Chitinophagaceae bacterium]